MNMIKVFLNFNGTCCECLHNMCLYAILAGQICVMVMAILIYMYLCQRVRYKHERFILQYGEDKKRKS